MFVSQWFRVLLQQAVSIFTVFQDLSFSSPCHYPRKVDFPLSSYIPLDSKGSWCHTDPGSTSLKSGILCQQF